VRAFQQVSEACFPRAALQGLRCQSVNLREQGRIIRETYHRTAMQRFVGDPMSTFSSTTIRAIGTVTRGVDRALTPSAPSCRAVSATAQYCETPATDESEYAEFIELLRLRLRSLTAEAPASAQECFQPCFVKCIVSTLLSYNERENQAASAFLRSRYLDGAAQIFNAGQGECAEIATLTSDIGTRLGIPISNASTEEHEFNQVELWGHTVTFDAASPSCLFFTDY